MYLSSNELTGTIPAELGSLINLRWLYLDDNQLSGEIPTELGNLFYLRKLYLAGNQLSGEIPAELGSLASLQELYLDNNQLTGVIPAELGTLGNLRDLYLAGNPLFGCVPDGLRYVPDNDLASLGLPFCGYSACATGGAVEKVANTGLVSDCITLLAFRDALAGTASLNWSADRPIAQWEGVTVRGTPQRVTRLDLLGKGLNGTIPSELGRLSMLTHLNLRTNGLTGSIPASLGNLKQSNLPKPAQQQPERVGTGPQHDDARRAVLGKQL